jgi:heme exporter protein D
MNGLVSGGWEFVWAAYGVSALVLTLFAVRAVLMARRPSRGPSL